MKYLAWYIFIIAIIQIVYQICSNKITGADRIAGVITKLPILIFCLYYLQII